MIPKLPVSPYGVTKLAGELLVRLHAVNYGLAAVSLRYFTVYGPRQRPDMGFHRFFRAIERGEPVIVFGDGEQTRDFTFVSDAVDANLLAWKTPCEPGTVFNIGGGSRVSIRQVIAMMERQCGRSVQDPSCPRLGGRRPPHGRRHGAGPRAARLRPEGRPWRMDWRGCGPGWSVISGGRRSEQGL